MANLAAVNAIDKGTLEMLLVSSGPRMISSCVGRQASIMFCLFYMHSLLLK
jgi:hypothetical protein